MTITSSERTTHGIVLAHELARPLQEIVEIEDGRSAFEGGIVGQHLVEFIGKLSDQRRGDAPEDHAVAMIHAREMAARLIVERSATILTGDLLPSRLRPWRQQIESVAAHARQTLQMSEPP